MEEEKKKKKQERAVKVAATETTKWAKQEGIPLGKPTATHFANQFRFHFKDKRGLFARSSSKPLCSKQSMAEIMSPCSCRSALDQLDATIQSSGSKPIQSKQQHLVGTLVATDTKKKTTKKKKPTPKVTTTNTECFTPRNQPVDLRTIYDRAHGENATFITPLTSRDLVVVSDLFSDSAPGELYAQVEGEIEACDTPQEHLLKPWHGNDKIEGAHMIADNKTHWKAQCPTFQRVVHRVATYFSMQWKPFHFDAAAVKPEVAATQNLTIVVSLGATRDVAFEHAGTKTVVSLPQPDGCIYAFAGATNASWRHGLLQDMPVRAEPRISIAMWGWIDGVLDLPVNEDAGTSEETRMT